VEWIIKPQPNTVLKDPARRRDLLFGPFLHIGLLFYFRKEELVSILEIAKTIF